MCDYDQPFSLWSSIHLHNVLLGTVTCTHFPQQEARKTPRMEGTTIFLYLFITTTIKRIPQCTILPFLKNKMFIPYLLYERFTLIIAPFLFMCTTKPPRIVGTTFFFHFFFITIVKKALKYTINFQSKTF